MTNDLTRPARLIAAGAACLPLLWAGSANAQQWGRLPTEQSSSADDDHVIIGVGAGYAPSYQGADDYRVLPMPAIDVDVGPFYANLRNGVGIKAVDTGKITLGGGVTVMPGYRSKDVPDGIGKLSIGVGGRLFASVNAGGVVATVGATKGFAGGTKGLLADASVSYPIPVTSRITVIPTVMTTWADSKYNNGYFGVSESQSLASGLSQFEMGSGFKDASAMLTVSYRMTDHIIVSASGGVTTLLGDVKDSPLVYHTTQPAGFMSVGYRF
ncbi:MipA/OmpV family protein [Novosphingobium sp. KA1]|uniref:MipA/OmpV family protein n=1 Tax=Novosphingobium sp. (strain KA1) TaxID=164608 RepID=UPI001A8C10DB|nr:MipA/OmpV family protein [Novosphingobium sp. KA1]QSR19673.1 hypothetical protein CA833_21230 [Novosphingobium sp. KA1]